MEILFTFLKLYYLFTFGVLTEPHTLAVREIPDNLTFITDFESTIVAFDVVYVTGKVTVYEYEKEPLKAYSPYQVEFYMAVGINVGQMRVEYRHWCIHPIVTYAAVSKTGPILYEGAAGVLCVSFGEGF